MSYFGTAGLAAGLLLGGAVSASAALIDFTDSTQWSGNQTVQNYGGLTVTLQKLAGVGAINFNQAFDGNEPLGSPLAFDNDGLGVGDDEISGQTLTSGEEVRVSFSNRVTVTELFFLDLFQSAQGASFERARVDLDDDGVYETIYNAAETVGGGNPGYLATTGFLPVKTSAIRFTMFTDPTLNDDLGVGDFALAGIDVAPVPLPAGALLLGTALAGFGVARRRKA